MKYLLPIILIVCLTSLASATTISFDTTTDDVIKNTESIFVNLTSSSDGDHYIFTDFNNDLYLWAMMEANQTDAGALVYDNSSYGNDGVANGGAVQTASGYFGNGFEFNGPDYILFSIGEFYERDMTFSAWIKMSNEGVKDNIFSIGDTTGDSSPQTLFQVDASNHLSAFGTKDGGGFDYLESTETVDTNWHHIVYLHDASVEEYHFYLDGSEATYSAGSIGNYTDYSDSANNLYIGVGYNNEYFNGTIDDILIFNRTLSSSEILALYNATANTYEHNFTGLNEENYSFIGYAVDTAGGVVNTGTRSVEIDITIPELSLSSPENTTYTTTTNLSLNYTANDTNLDSVWYSDDLGETNYTLSGNTSYSASQGSTTIYIWANDTAGNINNSESVTFIVDLPPEVTINFPTTSYISSTDSISLNITVVDNVTNPSFCMVSIDDWVTNYTMSNTSTSFNYTYSNLSDAVYTARFWCNDTINNINNTETIEFRIDAVPQVTLGSGVPAGVEADIPSESEISEEASVKFTEKVGTFITVTIPDYAKSKITYISKLISPSNPTLGTIILFSTLGIILIVFFRYSDYVEDKYDSLVEKILKKPRKTKIKYLDSV